MPLFKGQGCKSTPNKVIAYVTDEKKAAIVSSLNLDDAREYALQFRETANLHGKGKTYDERKYYHFKLSCARSDDVSAAEHHDYALKLAEKLFDGFECVVATHADTGTVHSHIVVNAVSFVDGHKLHCNQHEYGAMKDLANTLGAELGFSELDFRHPARSKITSEERHIELKGGTTWKEELREVVTLAKMQATNFTDFESVLNDYGVTLTRNTDKTIAYKHPLRAKAIRGEKLGADYTKGAITDELRENGRSESVGTVTANSGAQTNRNGEHAPESRLGAIERVMRNIVEGVESRTTSGRATAQRAAEAAERERQRQTEQNARERERATERQPNFVPDRKGVHL